MSIAKSVVTGTVYRTPEKRFTQNNIGVSAFVLDIGEKDELLVRIISRRAGLDEIVSSISKGDRVLVEGRLQTATVKADDGSEKRIYEIEAASIEQMSATSATNSSKFATEEIVKFESDIAPDELINEDEIPF
ncbi:MAG: single-stranded DNA-binding protein [Candidatus Gastranaerophilales bacterium]